jgi:DHA1 family chloramphenicol resistance protein-like MFS transporter
MIGGITLATIVGVPIGTWIGQSYGWRVPFLLLALLTTLYAILLGMVLPAREAEAHVRLLNLVRREIQAFRSLSLWLALSTTVLSQAAIFCAFTYLVPMLTHAQVIGAKDAPIILFIYGLGSLAGIYLGGKLADLYRMGVLLGGLALLGLALVGFLVVMRTRAGVLPAAFSFGTFAFSLGGALNARVFALVTGAPTLAASMNVSAFNVGNMIGPWIGGQVLSRTGSWSAPLWAAIALVIVTLAAAGASLYSERRGGRLVVRTISAHE